MRQYKEYDNRERRKQMKAKRVRKVFERRNNLTSEAEYNWIRHVIINKYIYKIDLNDLNLHDLGVHNESLQSLESKGNLVKYFANYCGVTEIDTTLDGNFLTISYLATAKCNMEFYMMIMAIHVFITGGSLTN